jgi:hypothetical protein
MLSVLVPITSPVPPQVADVHQELAAHLRDLSLEYEILYLLGTTSPEALEQLRSLAREAPATVRILQFGSAVGEAAMLSAGAASSRGEILLTVPARFETNLDVIAPLHQAIVDGEDLAYATRAKGHSGGSARFQSRMFNRLISGAAGTRFRDIASATRATRREVFQEIPLYGDFHRYLPLLAERLGFRIREIPAQEHPKASRPMIHTPLAYLWRAIDLVSVLFISRFTRKPLRLFGSVGAAFASIGLVILVVVTAQRFLGQPLADRPLLVLATLLVGLGVQAFTIGLLGELILFFHARNIRDYRIAKVYESDPPPLPRKQTGTPETPASAGAAAPRRGTRGTPPPGTSGSRVRR